MWRRSGGAARRWRGEGGGHRGKKYLAVVTGQCHTHTQSAVAATVGDLGTRHAFLSGKKEHNFRQLQDSIRGPLLQQVHALPINPLLLEHSTK
jgi:hypothetical protein